ncbi:MAG TPA: molybdopterin converting factor subunit 1 [Fimbriiglobus sp.]|jgi:molybdopterin converting factor subunit 1
MTVTVHLFAAARDLAGTSTVSVDLPTGATVAELRRVLADQVPSLTTLLARSSVAVNLEFAEDSHPITVEDEIAVIPPVSGG